MVSFTKRDIAEKLDDSENDIESVVQYIIKKLQYDPNKVCAETTNRLRISLRTFKCKYKMKYEKANRKQNRFLMQNENWLNSSFNVDIKGLLEESKVKAAGRGRPKMEFNDKQDRSKRQEIANMSAEHDHDPQKLIMACRYAARHSKQVDLNAILKKMAETPEPLTKIRKLLDTPQAQVEIKKKSAEEGLAFLLDGPMSKGLYEKMRLASIRSNSDIWPPYNNVRDAKESTSITESVAQVELQSLLNHTSKRILEIQHDSITLYMKQSQMTEMEILLMCSWGFDGSSGHSAYKQIYKSLPTNEEANNQNLFATTLIPLRLLTDNIVLWNNESSQSARFCRPIKLQFAKETQDLILAEKNNIENQINKLEVFKVSLDENRHVFIHYSLFLTLIDGKVLNIITGTKSMQTCAICHATPKTFNDISNKQKDIFLPNVNSLQHAIRSLHAWIRLFELCLHICYRLDVKVCQMRTKLQKDSFQARKKLIQTSLWKEFGLRVDKPKPGGSGTTNDGNTARRAFANPKLFAQLLGLNSQLVCNFQTILIALSSKSPLDWNKFDKFATATAKVYVAYYYWYPMPATLHKILMHGSEIISSSLLPVGMLGEEASEARNKNYKNYRESFSRKHNRTVNLEDVFNRVMDTSDPKISSINLFSRLQHKKLLSVPEQASNLFLISETENQRSSINNDEVDLDDEYEVLDETEISEILDELDEIVLSDNEDYCES